MGFCFAHRLEFQMADIGIFGVNGARVDHNVELEEPKAKQEPVSLQTQTYIAKEKEERLSHAARKLVRACFKVVKGRLS